MSTCNRCGGDHQDTKCPSFTAPREPAALLAQDGALALATFIGAPDGKSYFRSGLVDVASAMGLCLFEAMCGHMNDMFALDLRQLLMDYLVAHPNLIIKGIPLWRWVLLDAIKKKASPETCGQLDHIETEFGDQPTMAQINVLIRNYANMILAGTWGGAIEMTLFAHVYKLNVHEYVPMQCGGFLRMNMFNYSNAPGTETIRVVYKDNAHYDRLIPHGNLILLGVADIEVRQPNYVVACDFCIKTQIPTFETNENKYTTIP
jgi:hypothetical protein